MLGSKTRLLEVHPDDTPAREREREPTGHRGGGRLAALIGKEFIQLRRDRRTLGLIIFMPVSLILIFGYAASFDVQHLRVELVGHDSGVVRTALTAGNAFAVARPVVPDLARARSDIKHGRAVVAVALDPAGLPTRVVVDGSRLLEAMAAERKLGALQARTVPGLERITVETMFNPKLRSAEFMIPGLVGYIMSQVTIIFTAMAVVRERERGTIEQLMITPLSKVELMVGKALPYLVVAFFDLVSIILVGRLVFGVPVRGSVPLLFAISFAFLAATLGIGLLISTAAQNQQQAFQIAVFVMLPQMLLSGLVFPLASIPWGVRWISYTLPLTYYLPVVRGIFLRGVGLGDFWRPTMVLVVMALAFLPLAAARFRKRLD